MEKLKWKDVLGKPLLQLRVRDKGLGLGDMGQTRAPEASWQ